VELKRYLNLDISPSWFQHLMNKVRHFDHGVNQAKGATTRREILRRALAQALGLFCIDGAGAWNLDFADAAIRRLAEDKTKILRPVDIRIAQFVAAIHENTRTRNPRPNLPDLPDFTRAQAYGYFDQLAPPNLFEEMAQLVTMNFQLILNNYLLRRAFARIRTRPQDTEQLPASITAKIQSAVEETRPKILRSDWRRRDARVQQDLGTFLSFGAETGKSNPILETLYQRTLRANPAFLEQLLVFAVDYYRLQPQKELAAPGFILAYLPQLEDGRFQDLPLLGAAISVRLAVAARRLRPVLCQKDRDRLVEQSEKWNHDFDLRKVQCLF
jgi:hypothetical protein